MDRWDESFVSFALIGDEWGRERCRVNHPAGLKVRSCPAAIRKDIHSIWVMKSLSLSRDPSVGAGGRQPNLPHRSLKATRLISRNQILKYMMVFYYNSPKVRNKEIDEEIVYPCGLGQAPRQVRTVPVSC